jgi:serine/threonine protein kinase
MPNTDADRNLLFGLIALQNGLIDQDQLVAAFGAWSRDKARRLVDHLADRGDLDAEQRAAVNALVALHLKKHGDDPEKSLAAIAAGPSTRERLNRLCDPDIETSIAHVGSGSNGDVVQTHAHSLGIVTSEGQRFRVLRPHAQGGLGAVFVALDEELHREVALKEILDRHADDPVSRSRFLLEAEITGGLEHPGIVPVYGLGTYAGGRPYYAMRFIKGDSLKEAIERFHADAALKRDPGQRSLELRQLLRRFTDVCNAIGYAHSRGVLHRDIKPGNVIVGKHGETLVVDWGLAKAQGKREPATDTEERTLVPSSVSGSAETLPGFALGTPAYMSPEQAAGQLDQLGPWSDIYSLGATLYNLLTGNVPFAGDVGDVLRRVQEGKFPPPRARDRSIDPALEAVCLKAMALRPEDRYATPKALTDDIEQWMADEPVTAWREPRGRRVRRWVGRNRTLVTSVVSLLATAFVAMSVAIVLINAARSEAEKESRLRGIALRNEQTALAEAKKQTALAREAQKNQEAEAEHARTEAATTGAVMEALVNTFRAADPIGLEGLGIRGGSKAGQTLTAPEILDRSASLIKENLRDQPRVLATLMDTIGDIYRSMVQYDRAEPLLQEALEIRTRLYGRNHRDVATSLFHLGFLNQDLCKFDKAEALFRESIEMRTALLGPDDPETLFARRHLALLWLVAGEPGKSVPVFRELLARLVKQHGENHREVAMARLALASSLFESRYVEGGANLPIEGVVESQKGLKFFLSEPDPEPVMVAIGKFQNGVLLNSLKRYDAAERQFREAMKSFQAGAGPDHPYLAFFLHEIGANQEAMGKDAQAEVNYRACIDLARRSVGLRYPKVGAAVFSLASLLERTGRYQDARTIFQELIDARAQAYGDDHVRTAEAIAWFSRISYQHGDRAETIRLLNNALRIYRKQTTPLPELYATCLNNLGLELLDQKPRDAETLFREALPLIENRRGPKHSDTGIVLHNLARSLILQGRDDDETDQLLNRAVPILRSVLSAQPQSGVAALSLLAESETRRGLLEQAERHAREALESARLVLRKHPEQQAYTARGLGRILAARGDLKHAIPLFDEALKFIRRAGRGQENQIPSYLALQALARLRSGDPSGHREAVDRLMAEFGATRDPVAERQVAWAAARFPDCGVPASVLDALAGRVLNARPGNEVHRRIAAAALLRAGRAETALSLLEENRRARKADFGFDDALLAIAYHRLGRIEDARAALVRADAWAEGPEGRKRVWDSLLELTLLIKEAEDLLRDPPVALPDNVFGP